jgi:hypothetical protein
MNSPHPGIRIDAIQVEGAGGAIFALGMSALCVLAVPHLMPLVAVCLAGGVVTALVLHRIHY